MKYFQDLRTMSQTQEDRRRLTPKRMENSIESNKVKPIDKFLPVNNIQMY